MLPAGCRMHIRIDDSFWRDFPDATIGVVVARGVKAETSFILDDLKAVTMHDAVAHLTRDKIVHHPRIAAWRALCKKWGENPETHRLPLEQLLLALAHDKHFPVVKTPLLDVLQLVSARYLIPGDLLDLDAIDGDVTVTQATADEASVLLAGVSEPRKPHEGEIIFRDETEAIRHLWNWDIARRVLVHPSSRNVLFFFDALSAEEAPALAGAVYDAVHLIRCISGGVVQSAILNKQNATLSLEYNEEEYSVGEPLVPAEVPARVALYTMRPAQSEHEKETHHLNDEYKQRVLEVSELRSAGIEPWASPEEVTASCAAIKARVDDLGVEHRIAGRVVAIRSHGKTTFFHVQDGSGRLQVYLKEDEVGEKLFSFVRDFIDIGDWVWVKGITFITKTGELTLRAVEVKLLTKCLHPLPEKFHGLSDIEIKYRQRYLDLITSDEARERFTTRSHIITQLRTFLNEHEYLEVETPMLHPIPGGATARPFSTYHNALESEFYLRIAPELYLKRLVVGGLERVYEINRSFRNEGISTRHNPEYTMLEFYTAHRDYHFIMDFVETMFREIVLATRGSLTVPFGDKVIHFDRFERLSPQQVLIKYAGFTEADLEPAQLDATCRKHGVHIESGMSPHQKVFLLFEECGEEKIVDPVFVIDHPIEVSPLARRDKDRPQIAARFELFIAGMELGNGYNELNDPFDQAERFKEQAAALSAGDDEAMFYDADFVTALEYGLPPTVGVGVGIDRLTMLLTNTTSIKEVILFPTLRRKVE